MRLPRGVVVVLATTAAVAALASVAVSPRPAAALPEGSPAAGVAGWRGAAGPRSEPRRPARHSGTTQGARSLRDGVYTEEQAKRGDKLFETACAECHPTREFPPPGYFDSWTGATVDTLYELVRTTMPEDNPASLSRGEYADLFAFLFSRNGWPDGETELPSNAESLSRIRIEPPRESE